MLLTVRARILFFAVLSMGAVAGLAALSWTIILKAETTSNTLVRHHLEPSWLLVDLEQDHRRLQDLAFKIKAQLMLWGDITTEFESLSSSLETHWVAVEEEPALADWAAEHQENFAGVQSLMADMAAGIGEKSYYRVGQVVDFQLFPALEPMLDAIRTRQQVSRDGVTSGARELLAFLNAQQSYLLGGAAGFFVVVVVVMALWLRRSVILRLQMMEQELVEMEREADLTRTPRLSGRDEVAGVAGALEGLMIRFERFIADIAEQTNLNALKQHLEGLSLQFGELEHQSDAILGSVSLQRDEISRVGRRAEVLADSAGTLTESVEQTRRISDALREESLSMRQLAGGFRTREAH